VYIGHLQRILIMPVYEHIVGCRHLVFLFVLAVLASGCIHAGKESQGEFLFLQPVEADITLGEEVAEQVASQIGIVEDDALTEYVNAIAQRLVKAIPDHVDVPFTFDLAVVDQPEPNAFAAPGGKIFISRGLLMLAQNEDELAGVIAHEMVHVGKRHSAQRLQHAQRPKLLRLPGNAVSHIVDRDLGQLINAPVNRIGSTLLATYGRRHEHESDELGLELAALAGYDPASLPVILQRLEAFSAMQTGRSRRPTFQDSHPTTRSRVRRCKALAAGMTVRPVPPIADAAALLQHLDGLTMATNPAAGVFTGDTFRHPELGIQMDFPSGWQHVNTPSAAGAVTRRGDALVMLGAKGIGVTPEAAAKKMVRDMEQRFRMGATRSESIDLKGAPGWIVTFADTTGREPVYIYFLWVEKGGILYEMVGMGGSRYKHSLK
jgi:predicted Zn-dependent protease